MSSDAYLDAMAENGPTHWLVSLEIERIRQHEPVTMEAIFRQRAAWWSRGMDDDEVVSRFIELVLSTARRLH